ncbi:MAG: hypothetical protein B6I20_12275, partial [Bacteroidetes bacterium 4572_117]
SSEPWVTLGISYSNVMDTFNDDFNELYAAYVNNEIVGVIVIQTKGAFTGYLKSIAVKTGWQNKHLGKSMMGFVENEIFSKKTNVFLCVSSFNHNAQKFYLKLGYKKVGVLENYIINGHDEILMRKTTGPIC